MTSPLKLLVLAHRVPYPPNKGDKIRAFHELRAFRARGYQTHLICFADDPADRVQGQALTELCDSVLIVPLNPKWATLRSFAGLVTGEALSIRYFGSPDMGRAVQEALKRVKPQGIFVYCSSMAQYIPEEYRSRTVVDLVDADSEKWRDYASRTPQPVSSVYRLESRRLRAYERRIIRDFAASVVCTEREADLLREPSITKSDRVHAIVNGVDSAHYQMRDDRLARPQSVRTEEKHFFSRSGRPRLVFTGAMDYKPNVDAVCYFADEIFPGILREHPDAEFLIVGSKPNRRVRRLARQSRIVVTGFVSDVRPYLSAATVCVVPLRVARGIQNKLLEAMACGCAIVATPEAAAALQHVSEQELLIRSGAVEFAAAVNLLIEDAGLRRTLGTRARRYVVARHRWDLSLAHLIKVVDSAMVKTVSTPRPRLANVALFHLGQEGQTS